MCAESAVARWRGEPAVGTATLCAAVAGAAGPACWVPQPASAIAAQAAVRNHRWRRQQGVAGGREVMAVRRTHSAKRLRSSPDRYLVTETSIRRR